MAVIDARDSSTPQAHDVDVCIVGAGAAGIALATRLGGCGRRILLLEAGGLRMDSETQELHRVEDIGHPLRRDYHSRARFYGGSCNLWAGRNMLLGEDDFAPRKWLPASGWPIGSADLAPWYPEACRFLDLPGPEAFSPDRAAAQYSPAERRFFSHPDVAPTISVWAKSPARPGRIALPYFKRSSNITLLLNASAVAIRRVAGSSRAGSVEAATLSGRRIAISAGSFVLACGGLENARLLMLSDDWPASGPGNAGGLLGRCFMDHPRAVHGRFFTAPGAQLRALLGRAMPDGRTQIGIRLNPQAQARQHLPNHYVTFEPESSQYASEGYQALAQAAKLASGTATSMKADSLPELIYLLRPRELIPHFAYRVVQALRDRVRLGGQQRPFVVVYFCEQPPGLESRAVLGGARDALGMPRLQLDWRLDTDFIDSVVRTEKALADILHETGIGRLEPGRDTPRFTDASHHMGTTRMSHSPYEGVVDPDCRVHGVPNLFVAGSSVFPCGGHANPTLTIVALALRIAHKLDAELTESSKLR